MQLASHGKTLDLSSPVVMGIVNVTPDSFSDGGQHYAVEDALEHALAMCEAGAAIIDIGGESTRPGAEPVPAVGQVRRVMPLLEKLRAATDAFLSVDTGDAEVIRTVTAAGADMINDIYALRQPGALEAAADGGVAVCIMHMQGVPATMQDAPRYVDVTAEVFRFLRSRAEQCRAAGIARERIVLDPGFGFGKTHEHNLQLLANFGEFADLGYPLLAGVSRKGTLGHLTGRPVDQRMAASLAAGLLAVERGASIVRTHDVPETVDALRIVDAVRRAEADRATRSVGGLE
jgi:dihydropteroate synthase